MQKTSTRNSPIPILKMLFSAIKKFFKGTHNRDFDRLKDFISS